MNAEEQPTTKPRQQPRVRRVSQPPPPLWPMTLSKTPAEATARVSDEEIAEAALRQLLRRDEGHAPSARASSAASVARRYFSSSQPARAQPSGPPPESLRALGIAKGQGRYSRMLSHMSALLALCLLGALLFTALLTVG